MRPCPVCQSARRDVIVADYSKPSWDLYKCASCHMLYADCAEATEQTMDWYYRHVYRTDDKPYSDDRLNSLADFVLNMGLDVRILDIGGMDGELQARLKTRGFSCVDTSGPGDLMCTNYGVIVLSHTLEHVYNLPGMMEKITEAITPLGWVVVEVPIWCDDDPLTYDYHWQHINKFRPGDLKRLFRRYGFHVAVAMTLPDYREYHTFRLAAQYGEL